MRVKLWKPQQQLLAFKSVFFSGMGRSGAADYAVSLKQLLLPEPPASQLPGAQKGSEKSHIPVPVGVLTRSSLIPCCGTVACAVRLARTQMQVLKTNDALRSGFLPC